MTPPPLGVGSHPVPLEVRERRVRELLERLAEAIARGGYGEISDLDFLAPPVAEQVRTFALAYRSSGVVAEPEWGDEGQAVAHFPEDRSGRVCVELLVDDRSVLRSADSVLPARQKWRFRVETDGLARRIERLRIEALG